MHEKRHTDGFFNVNSHQMAAKKTTERANTNNSVSLPSNPVSTITLPRIPMMPGSKMGPAMPRGGAAANLGAGQIPGTFQDANPYGDVEEEPSEAEPQRLERRSHSIQKLGSPKKNSLAHLFRAEMDMLHDHQASLKHKSRNSRVFGANSSSTTKAPSNPHTSSYVDALKTTNQFRGNLQDTHSSFSSSLKKIASQREKLQMMVSKQKFQVQKTDSSSGYGAP